MITIRQAEEQDLAAIECLARAIWPSTFKDILSEKQIDYMLHMMYSDESLKNQLRELNHIFLLAEELGKPIGFISYQLNYINTTSTKIHKIYLLPSLQGKGLGKRLINEVQKIAVINHQTSITLNVNKFNKAYDFYVKLGFKHLKNEDIEIGNGFLMEDAMLELNPIN